MCGWAWGLDQVGAAVSSVRMVRAQRLVVRIGLPNRTAAITRITDLTGAAWRCRVGGPSPVPLRPRWPAPTPEGAPEHTEVYDSSHIASNIAPISADPLIHLPKAIGLHVTHNENGVD